MRSMIRTPAAILATLVLAACGGSRAAPHDTIAIAGATPSPPRPAVGTIRFIAEPADAAIQVEGFEPHPGSPWTLTVEPGSYQVEIARAGYQPYVTSVEILAGETQTLRAALVPQGSEGTVALSDVTSWIPARCADYLLEAARFASCDKVPREAADAVVQGATAMKDGWAVLSMPSVPAEAIKAAVDACTQAVDAIDQASRALGCAR